MTTSTSTTRPVDDGLACEACAPHVEEGFAAGYRVGLRRGQREASQGDTVGAHVRGYRVRVGLSEQVLARRAGLRVSDLQRIELGLAEPSLTELCTLLQVLTREASSQAARA